MNLLVLVEVTPETSWILFNHRAHQIEYNFPEILISTLRTLLVLDQIMQKQHPLRTHNGEVIVFVIHIFVAEVASTEDRGGHALWFLVVDDPFQWDQALRFYLSYAIF